MNESPLDPSFLLFTDFAVRDRRSCGPFDKRWSVLNRAALNTHFFLDIPLLGGFVLNRG
jgi:hypothetical protein